MPINLPTHKNKSGRKPNDYSASELSLEELESLPTPKRTHNELSPSERLLLDESDEQINKPARTHPSGLAEAFVRGDEGKPFVQGERRAMPIGRQARGREAEELVKQTFLSMIKESGEDADEVLERIRNAPTNIRESGDADGEQESLQFFRDLNELYKRYPNEKPNIRHEHIQDMLKKIPMRTKS